MLARALLVHAHRCVQRERHRQERAHVGHGHARVGHRQEREREDGGRRERLHRSPQPPRHPEHREHTEHAEHRGQRAAGAVDRGGVLAVLLDSAAVMTERQHVPDAVLEAQREVDKVRVRGGVLVIARIGTAAEHPDCPVGEVRPLVDVVDVGQPVGVVQNAQHQPHRHDQSERPVDGRGRAAQASRHGRDSTAPRITIG